MRSRERHEGNPEQVPAAERAVGVLQEDEEALSCPGLADRYDHPAARLELLDEGRGDLLGRGRDYDAIERDVLRRAEIAVAHPDCHVPITEPLQGSPGVVAELRHDLDRVDVIDRVWVA
jgi:uncharacterized Zn-finger protein